MSAVQSRTPGQPPRLVPDQSEMLRALRILHDGQGVIELRALYKHRKRVDAGCFDGDHSDLLVKEAARLNAAGAAVYVTMNPVDPQLLARYANRTQEFASATATDANVTARRWLLVDIDPQRPKDTSATDDQLKRAGERAECVREFLDGLGWPDPVVAESGNGFHLLYRVELPNDTASADLVKGCLEALAKRFDDAAIKIDRSVFNAARIIKLHGSVANKGDHVLLAPWRSSRITSAPAVPCIVDPALLQALADEARPAAVASGAPALSAGHAWTEAHVTSFLARGSIEAVGPEPHDGAQRWKLKACPFNADHGAGESAVFLRPDGKLGFECRHNSCQDKHWGDLRTLVDGDRRPKADAKATPKQGRVSRTQGATTRPATSVDSTDGDLDSHANADTPERVVIQLEPGQLHNYAADAERLLASEIYVRGQQLVRIGKAPELQAGQPDELRRDDSQAVVVPVGVEFLRRRLTAVAEVQAYRRREKEWVTVDCPKDLASNIVGAGDWAHFKGLDSIATAPFLRPDHTLCDQPGYDEASRVFLAPNATFPALRANPTKQDAEEALQELCEPFSEFPFASDEAKAAFLSHLLTSAVRHAIDVAPVYSYTAPLPGTGKSLLAGMAARIQAGALAPLRPYVEDSEELRKTLFAALLAGDTTLVLDNVPNGQRVRSPMLCGFVTAPVYSDRRLGVSEAPRLPNCCTVVMTGNNITAAGDLARRCIIVRLDANTESARGRDFKIEDLGRYVTEHRPRLLAAALTIVRAYVVAGCPKGFRPLPSFERWSRLARDPLTWLGCADPVDTQEQEADDELGPLRAAFAALAAVPTFAASVFTARQVAQFCGGYDEDAKALREIVEAAGCSDASNATKVGYWLRASRDRVAGGLKLKHRVAGQGVAKWKLESISF